MSTFGSNCDIQNLSSLLDESRLTQETRNEKYSQPPVLVGPSTVVLGNKKTAPAITEEEAKALAKKSKDIWNLDELPNEDSLVDWNDERPKPRFEFSYKQSVGTEDTFLGMSEKTPLTSDCTHLVIKIHFPHSTMKDLDLNVTKNRIKASSKMHHLFTYLPVTVDADNGNAKFDTSKEVLTVTVPILSEY